MDKMYVFIPRVKLKTDVSSVQGLWRHCKAFYVTGPSQFLVEYPAVSYEPHEW